MSVQPTSVHIPCVPARVDHLSAKRKDRRCVGQVLVYRRCLVPLAITAGAFPVAQRICRAEDAADRVAAQPRNTQHAARPSRWATHKIAADLDVSVGSVRTHINRGTTSLERRLGGLR